MQQEYKLSWPWKFFGAVSEKIEASFSREHKKSDLTKHSRDSRENLATGFLKILMSSFLRTLVPGIIFLEVDVLQLVKAYQYFLDVLDVRYIS